MILEHQHDRKGGVLPFIALLAVLIGLAVYVHQDLRQSELAYTRAQAVLDANASTIRKFSVPGSDQPLYLPDPGLVQPGNIWGLVSRNHPLSDGYTPADLVATSVAHGDKGQEFKVQQHIEMPLRALFAAAEADGVELMLSSAYRSIPEQRALYESFVAEQGEEMAKIYVAQPQTSEHHTGLSVDLSSASAACEIDSNDCSLSQSDAAWLAERAHEFGFIQRYPEGKQPITGVGFEPWHYRYVGVTLAKAISQSDLTLDEVIEQVAPGLKPKD